MLEKLFNCQNVFDRHRKAPFFDERDRYLEYRASEGCTYKTLLRIARELIHIVQLLKISSESKVTFQQIRTAANRWARHQYRTGRAQTLKWPRDLFIQVATDWLRFINRLEEFVVKPPSFMSLIDAFAQWMESDRGLSLVTIRNYCWHVKKFLHWCEDHGRVASTIKLSDVDMFLASCGDKGWSRVSVATAAKSLKAFFRCAEQCDWPLPAIAYGIQSPRLFSQESLSSGPSWEDVNRLIDKVATDRAQDIRDRAILLLFAIYALRSSEVASLRLNDINWENKQISVFRSKQRRTQFFPLSPIVGNAIIRYLKWVRPKSSSREIFLRLRPPFKPLSIGGLYNVVSRCMEKADVYSAHRGPHTLRHACAMHLITEGFSLKEIGDHLGHRSTSATRIYAKVNLSALRLVADIDLGGLS